MQSIRHFRPAAAWFVGLALTLFTVFALAGCSSGKKDHDKEGGVEKHGDDHKDHGNEADVKAERAKLQAEDRKLVDEQDACPIMPEHKLGSMGLPVKVVLKEQPVFVCCKGCVKKAERNPDETLAKVAELKDKNRTGPK